MRFAYLGISACILASPTSGAFASKIQDASFEAPVVPPGSEQTFNPGDGIGPWTVVGTGSVALVGADFSLDDLSLQAKTGDQFIDLAGGRNTHSGIEQTFKTQAGKSYFLWFRVGTLYDPARGFGHNSTVTVTLDGVPQGFFKVMSTDKTPTEITWGRAGIFFTATGKQTTVDFKDADHPNDAFCGLDGVSLRAVRAP
ncbi:MAG: DUF642 domain-containing protein [Alphaproteobacteria bacterium]|nr:DUF642 domain-containing protein [Alphaproteobacteria bacterium]